MKKILTNGLIIGVFIAVIAFVPDAGNRLLTWLVPPRLFILIGVAALIILWKILIELRNRNERNDSDE